MKSKKRTSEPLLFNFRGNSEIGKTDLDVGKVSEFDSYLKEHKLSLLDPNLIGDLFKIEKNAKSFLTVFAKGDLSLMKMPLISVVGTRTPTEEGKKMAAAITRILVRKGYCIVSGLATGIDTIAHTTALEMGGKTIAVLGTPIHKIYPKENIELAKEIIVKGLLLSPSLPTELKGRHLFPRRNRLMAAMTIGTVVVEAGETSGVIHQAKEAVIHHRKLFFSSMLANQNFQWVQSFLNSGDAIKLTRTTDIEKYIA
ncbi:DNA-processing protein DprA [Leptospira perdikensis]|uniref:DNA-processing protein DprA n=1 Tax=Leptospira perdikensis TaxID=2484948 RepID=UPI001FC98F3C|nr:DNA-processing protein DprA [Leptospira perdikensis]